MLWVIQTYYGSCNAGKLLSALRVGIILEGREEEGGEREIDGRMEDVTDKTEANVAGEKEEEGWGGQCCVTGRAGENVQVCVMLICLYVG